MTTSPTSATRPRLRSLTRALAPLLLLGLAVGLSACRTEHLDPKTKPFIGTLDTPYEVTNPKPCTYDEDTQTVTVPMKVVARASDDATDVKFTVTVTSADAAYSNWTKKFETTVPATGGVQRFTVPIHGVTKDSWDATQTCVVTLNP